MTAILLLSQQAHALSAMYQPAHAPAATSNAPIASANPVAVPAKAPVELGNLLATPVKLARAERLKPSSFLSTGVNVRLQWQSVIPGLQFCVSYASAHGLNILSEHGGRTYTSERVHCMVADRDGRATDSIATFDQGTSSNDGLLIANIVLIDNKVSTEVIHVGQLAEIEDK
ncbi:TPA: hypothetical protein QDB04_002878 [Burkholderia vietnamiensis]|nr:hypothetical protein [Burkholderia vietnamiensis]